MAAVHAGWRGLAAGIVEVAVARFACPGEKLLAWMGPAICQTHFEVGPDVLEAFLDGVPDELARAQEACFVPGIPGKYQADLYTLTRLRLGSVGVTGVFGGEHCTYADPARFFSWRRGQDTGRLFSVILRKN